MAETQKPTPEFSYSITELIERCPHRILNCIEQEDDEIFSHDIQFLEGCIFSANGELDAMKDGLQDVKELAYEDQIMNMLSLAFERFTRKPNILERTATILFNKQDVLDEYDPYINKAKRLLLTYAVISRERELKIAINEQYFKKGKQTYAVDDPIKKELDFLKQLHEQLLQKGNIDFTQNN